MSVTSYDTSRKVVTHNSTPAQWKRVTKHTPCEVCGAKKLCEYTDDGWLHCFDDTAARARGGRPWDKRQGGYLISPDNRPARTLSLLLSQPALTPLAVAPPALEPPRAVPSADADTLHAVYTSLLELCPLMKAHGELLTGAAHGLTVEQARRYGTLPRDARKVCAALEERHGRATLLGVPGFVETDGRLVVRGAGIIMPTRDVQGRIVAIDVRREKVEPGQAKYFKLSSGTAGGASSGTPAHVARPRELRDARTVYVTEGVKKADVAADALSGVVVGVVGHSTWRHALPALDELAEAGATECVIALDRDTNPQTAEKVNASRRQLAAAAVELGYAVRLAVWDAAAAKGLDDLVQAGLTPMRERYRPLLADGEAHAQLAAQYETVRAREADVSRLMTMPHMKPTDKAVVHAIWNVTGQYPSAYGEEPPPLIQLSRDYIASQAGVSAGTAGNVLPDLAELGIIRRELRYDSETKQSMLWLGAGRLPETPWTKEELQTPSRAKDRERKVCPNCGSSHLAVRHYICEDCNALCTPEEASDAGAAAREAEEIEEAKRAEAGLNSVDTLDSAVSSVPMVFTEGRAVDPATGEILEHAPTPPLPACPPLTCSPTPLPWDEEKADALIRAMIADCAEAYNGSSGGRPGEDAVNERVDVAYERHDMDALVRQVNALRALYGVYKPTAGDDSEAPS